MSNIFWLYNTGDEEIGYMHDGRDYRFGPKEFKGVSWEVKEHLLKYLSSRGLEEVHSPEEIVRKKMAEEGVIPNKVVCEFCGKEFEGEKAEFRLKQHIPHCPRNVGKINKQPEEEHDNS